MFYQFTSYLSPAAVYRVDVKQMRSEPYTTPKLPVDLSGFETKQVFYTSKDGTRVPMFITDEEGHRARRHQSDDPLRIRRVQHLADARRSRSRISSGWRWAAFTRSRTFAAAASTARTGMKAGQARQEAERLRRLHRRGRVSDREKYTSAPKLAISGGSNGGLLVGAVMNAATRAVRRGASGGRRDGHAAVPQVHDRLGVGIRLRLVATTRSSSRLCARIRRCTTSNRARSIRRR